MNKSEFLRAALARGPGLNGYAYCADVYCVDCGRRTIRELAEAGQHEKLTSTDDPSFRDSENIPQPIFFGESDAAQHCGDCGVFLYGEGEPDVEEVEEDDFFEWARDHLDDQ